MRVLYPDDPLNQRRPEGLFAAEYDLARARGFDVSIFSFEDFDRGRFSPKPQLAEGEAVIYRGWMLKLDGYERLMKEVSGSSARMVVSLENYRNTHHLPSWYPLIKDLTAETLVFEENTDFVTALRDRKWSGYFVKDYAKSLNTGTGSLVETPDEIARVVAQIKKYRGEVEGGVCIRRREEYESGSERRYFIAKGRAFSSSGDIPDVVAKCASLVASPFFTIDTALRKDGVWRIVEVGDGQVSDRKEWSAERLVEVLEHVG